MKHTGPPRYPRAEYECNKCHGQWKSKSPMMEKCPWCGHGYVYWINYKLWTGEK